MDESRSWCGWALCAVGLVSSRMTHDYPHMFPWTVWLVVFQRYVAPASVSAVVCCAAECVWRNARHHSIGSSECGPDVVSLVRRSWLKSILEVWLSGGVLDGFVSVCGLTMHCPPCPQCRSLRDWHCSRTLLRRLNASHTLESFGLR